MQTRKFDEMISYFNRKVSDMYIDRKYKMELLAMITAIGMAHEKELDAQLEQRWIPCSERLPKEEIQDYWVCLENGYQQQCRWMRYGHFYEWHTVAKVVAWMPLPECYRGKQDGKIT